MAERIPYFRPSRPQPKPINAYEQRSERLADKGFYARAAWRRVRDLKLRLNPLCEDLECTEIATHVHHRQPRKARPDLSYDVENLQSLCQRCHNRQDVR